MKRTNTVFPRNHVKKVKAFMKGVSDKSSAKDEKIIKSCGVGNRHHRSLN